MVMKERNTAPKHTIGSPQPLVSYATVWLLPQALKHDGYVINIYTNYWRDSMQDYLPCAKALNNKLCCCVRCIDQCSATKSFFLIDVCKNVLGIVHGVLVVSVPVKMSLEITVQLQSLLYKLTVQVYCTTLKGT